MEGRLEDHGQGLAPVRLVQAVDASPMTSKKPAVKVVLDPDERRLSVYGADAWDVWKKTGAGPYTYLMANYGSAAVTLS
jgi:hypothetical protein